MKIVVENTTCGNKWNNTTSAFIPHPYCSRYLYFSTLLYPSLLLNSCPSSSQLTPLTYLSVLLAFAPYCTRPLVLLWLALPLPSAHPAAGAFTSVPSLTHIFTCLCALPFPNLSSQLTCLHYLYSLPHPYQCPTIA